MRSVILYEQVVCEVTLRSANGALSESTVTTQLMSAAYQPVPTDLDDTDRTQPDKTRRNIPYFRKLVLLTLGFCLVALVSFKAGQWSAQPHFEENQTPAAPEQEQEEEIPVSPTTPANDADMPGNGKYSVG